LIECKRKSAYHVGQKLENGWLSRYPRPMRCIHDQGTEFQGSQFQLVLENNGIEDVTMTIKNPQASERVHETVGNVLRTMTQTNPPQDMLQTSEMIDA
jgi:transposase InsO family protein